MGQGNKKLSKRDPEAHALAYREQGFLPEGLLNYLALLGWAIAADRDIFSLAEMVEAFDIKDVNPNPARFDLKKAEAINASQMRLLSVEDITHRALPFLKEAGVVGDPVSDADAQLLELAMPLVAERINKLTEAAADARLPLRRRGRLRARRRRRRQAARRDRPRRRPGGVRRPRRGSHEWSTAAIEEALRVALIEGWSSSRASPSARSGSPSPASGSARRCSSRWSCWVASGAWRGCSPPSPERRTDS